MEQERTFYELKMVRICIKNIREAFKQYLNRYDAADTIDI